MGMFKKELRELVKKVEGAYGAVFLAEDGEYVQLTGKLDSYKNNLLGIYQGILLQQLRDFSENLLKDNVDFIISHYEKAIFITKNLKENYFLVLILSKEGNIGAGVMAINYTATILNKEIF